MANKTELKYLSGFLNHFETEAVPGTLPQGQNSPQKVAHGLYAEQLTGSSFTAPRHENLRSWLYRLQPAVVHGAFKKLENTRWQSATGSSVNDPNQLRWDPPVAPRQPSDFIDGLSTTAVCGNLGGQFGLGVHLYSLNQSMKDRYLYNADGEMLFVPQKGTLLLHTELGTIEINPREIAVIPRGIRFQVELKGSLASGYVCENYGAPFRLPGLGPIGANGLANPRDFQTPVARFEKKSGRFQLIARFQGALWQAELDHSPLDVVAWHGNYAPYKYNLDLFNTINSVSFDHPDPSIFTVLTSPTDTPGTANCDFVIFPPRWMVAEHTFRPPYFHRNCMSEYMGLIEGEYDAKSGGFLPGGGSLHNRMSGHGPDFDSFQKATEQELKPQRYENTLAFMFESRYVFQPTEAALKSPTLQKNYQDCWKGLKVLSRL